MLWYVLLHVYPAGIHWDSWISGFLNMNFEKKNWALMSSNTFSATLSPTLDSNNMYVRPLGIWLHRSSRFCSLFLSLLFFLNLRLGTFYCCVFRFPCLYFCFYFVLFCVSSISFLVMFCSAIQKCLCSKLQQSKAPCGPSGGSQPCSACCLKSTNNCCMILSVFICFELFMLDPEQMWYQLLHCGSAFILDTYCLL